ncbi:MAG: hypothetical protein ABI365_10380 [Lysobacteraceae bacterium]
MGNGTTSDLSGFAIAIAAFAGVAGAAGLTGMGVVDAFFATGFIAPDCVVDEVSTVLLLSDGNTADGVAVAVGATVFGLGMVDFGIVAADGAVIDAAATTGFSGDVDGDVAMGLPGTARPTSTFAIAGGDAAIAGTIAGCATTAALGVATDDGTAGVVANNRASSRLMTASLPVRRGSNRFRFYQQFVGG